MSTTTRQSNSKLPEMKTKAPESSNSGGVNWWTVTDSVARFDENARRRLESMNQKLRNMERQMETLEADMRKVHASSLADVP